MGKKGSIKRDLIIFLCIIIIAVVVFICKEMNDSYDRYDIGDYGVSIRVPVFFVVDAEDKDNLLSLHTEDDAMFIKARDLKGDFWSSDEMDVIMDKYIRLVSAKEYDSNVDDVEYEKRKVDFKEVGVVKLSLNNYSSVNRGVAILTHKANGFLVIEIYGSAEIIDMNEEFIDKIINTIKFSENKHDYSKDSSRGIMDKYRDVSGESMPESLNT